MKNHVQRGSAITVIAPSGGVVSGQALLVGDLFGVCLHDAAQTLPVVMETEGVFTLKKATGTINPGVRVFWDDTAKRITTTTTSNRCVGWHVGTVANTGGDNADILVKLGRPNAVAA